MLELSVIICTYNPNLKYLQRTIDAIHNQTISREKWELLMIDNGSNFLVEESMDISWHPLARHLREDNPGLTAARIRGIRESKGEILVFVDDDNCLKKDFLEVVRKTMLEMPLLGVVGAGRIIPDFEVKPSQEETQFLRSLAIRNESRAHFSNDIKYHKGIPYGAGLCVRRSIGLLYAESFISRFVSIPLGRIGNGLLSGEDIDLALFACYNGYLAGVIPELELIHIIPEKRLNHDYLVKIAAGHSESSYYLSQIWHFEEYPENPLIKWGRYWKKRLTTKGLSKKILIAEYKAERKARLQWKKLNKK